MPTQNTVPTSAASAASQIGSQLDQIERQFNEIASKLASGDPQQLVETCEALQTQAVELLQSWTQQGKRSDAFPLQQAMQRQQELLRIKKLSSGLGTLRDCLSRRSAYVTQALQVLVPTEKKHTYGSKAEGSSVFGNITPQSGAFRVLSA